MEFTENAIAAIKPEGIKKVYRDPSLPNLELRYYQNGSRKFWYRSRNKAYVKDVPLGTQLAEVLPIYDALFNIRHLPPVAEAPIHNLFRDNANINILKQRFIRDYCQQNITEDTSGTYLGYINRVITYLEDNSCRLGTTVCSETEARDELTDFLDMITEIRPTTSNRIKSTLSKMFNFGIHKKLVTANPVQGIPSNTEKPREFYINDIELGSLLQTFYESHCNPKTIDALRFILLTGLRSGEIRAIKRDMIDFSNARLVLPGTVTKNGLPHLVALSNAAMAILKRWAEKLSGDTTVFSFGTHTLHQACTRMSQKAGHRATPHDLRKTFATQLAMLGTNDGLIVKMLNHTPAGVTERHYQFYQKESERRLASENLAQKLIQMGL